MSKIVLVETVSSFRHVHAVELPDDSPDDWAVEDVISEMSKDDPDMSEVGQKWISEEIFSHRVVDEKEYLRVFDEMNGPYFAEWPVEKKKEFIFKRKQEA
jgi:hypothetical protein